MMKPPTKSKMEIPEKMEGIRCDYVLGKKLGSGATAQVFVAHVCADRDDNDDENSRALNTTTPSSNLASPSPCRGEEVAIKIYRKFHGLSKNSKLYEVTDDLFKEVSILTHPAVLKHCSATVVKLRDAVFFSKTSESAFGGGGDEEPKGSSSGSSDGTTSGEIYAAEDLQEPYQTVGLVFDYFPLGSLAVFAPGLAFQERLDLASHFLHDILSALVVLHDLGFVHRDLKPDNLLVRHNNNNNDDDDDDNNDGRERAGKRRKSPAAAVAQPEYSVVLADFGRAIHCNALDQDRICTTIHVRSPEQALAQPYDSHADLWSAAVTVLAFLFSYGDETGEFQPKAIGRRSPFWPHIFFRRLVGSPRLQGPHRRTAKQQQSYLCALERDFGRQQQARDADEEDEWLVEEIDKFFQTYGRPSDFLRSMCLASGMGQGQASRFQALGLVLDGLMHMESVKRWNARDALDVLAASKLLSRRRCGATDPSAPTAAMELDYDGPVLPTARMAFSDQLRLRLVHEDEGIAEIELKFRSQKDKDLKLAMLRETVDKLVREFVETSVCKGG